MCAIKKAFCAAAKLVQKDNFNMAKKRPPTPRKGADELDDNPELESSEIVGAEYRSAAYRKTQMAKVRTTSEVEEDTPAALDTEEVDDEDDGEASENLVESIDNDGPSEADVDEPEAVPPRQKKYGLFGWLLRFSMYVLCLPLVLTLVYVAIPPPFTNVMILRAIGGYGITKKWMPIDLISPHLARAVITSEDARFCEHSGVDWTEIQNIVEDVFDDDEGAVRGASTISMQTAKNVFLWDGRSIVRKGLELPLAAWMDLVWTKKRMMEVYLNIVEWAPGIYGAEAAAQHHFKKSAAALSRREAALLAAVLPNPIKRKAGKPSRRVRAAADRIQQRLVEMGPYLTCVP
jgi:monofunctional glycosyltransferase